MLTTLKLLFLSLSYSEETALNPVFFAKTIKTADNKPVVKVFMQMDIDEYCSIFFDRL